MLSSVKEVFIGMDYEKEQLFKHVLYELTLDQAGRHSEKLSVSNDDGTYVPIIEHRTDSNGVAIGYFIELENHFGAKKARKIDTNWERNTTSFDKTIGILTRGNGTVAYKIGDMIAKFLFSSKIMSTNFSPRNLMGSKEEFELTPNAENVVTVLNTLINYTEEHSELLKQFRRFLGDDKALLIAPPVANNITAQLGESGLNTKTNLANFSKGLERLLIMLLVFRGVSNNSIVCIEEPETHLHARAQKELMLFFEKNSRNHQIFITTHSPIFTKFEDDSVTYLIDKYAGISDCLQVNTAHGMRAIRSSLGVANSDIYLPNGILYLEGTNDLNSFLYIGNALKFEGIDKRVVVENLGGTGNSKKLKFLARYFKKSNLKIYAILDNHKENVDLKEELVRENLVDEDNVIIRRRQFEDLFESDLIVKCMKEISEEKRFNFDLDEKQLEKERTNEEVVKILGRYVTNIKDYKTSLAKKLTSYTVSNLASINFKDESSISNCNDFVKENHAIMKRITDN
jgi:hypothetical protein